MGPNGPGSGTNGPKWVRDPGHMGRDFGPNGPEQGYIDTSTEAMMQGSVTVESRTLPPTPVITKHKLT